jgi:hypothetical protein
MWQNGERWKRYFFAKRKEAKSWQNDLLNRGDMSAQIIEIDSPVNQSEIVELLNED